ncbi:MAG: hypothetical protein IJU31_01895, partial [Synergistaceae bacterium]|nr:hypothetical protein [Synergistaceae bacterium]
MNVIIPSAKNVPQNLSAVGLIPAVIYPINQRIVFDYIREQYGDSQYTVVVHENASEVTKQLARYENVKIFRLSRLADLGWSVLNGIAGLEGAAVVNFADTIVNETLSEGTFFYAEDNFSDTWTFFEESGGVFSSITDKKHNAGRNGKGKLFVGVFSFQHVEYFAHCIETSLSAKNSEMDSFYTALQLYSQKYPLTPVKTGNWLDIGHPDKYYNSQIEVQARVFNHIKIDKERGILTKSSDDTEKFIGEIKWYLKLPNDVEYVRPRIFNYSMEYSAPFVSMEYYAYHTIHELFLYGKLSPGQWNKIFKRIKFVCSDFGRYRVKGQGIAEALEDMYLNKTLERLKRLERDSAFTKFFTNCITINSQKFLPLNDIISKLKILIPAKLFNVAEFCIIHGDLCFSNIMIDNNFSFVKVIDPRGKFGKFDIYGDQRYEFAKLFHSVDGKYDFIIKDLFEISFDTETPNIDFTINNSERASEICKIFLEVFGTDLRDLKEIELIESLLFFSMIPLHNESQKHQMAMLAT